MKLQFTWSVFAMVFVALKALNLIDWPWVWVLCPLWAPLAIVGLVLTFAITLPGIALICIFVWEKFTNR